MYVDVPEPDEEDAGVAISVAGRAMAASGAAPIEVVDPPPPVAAETRLLQEQQTQQSITMMPMAAATSLFPIIP